MQNVKIHERNSSNILKKNNKKNRFQELYQTEIDHTKSTSLIKKHQISSLSRKV